MVMGGGYGTGCSGRFVIVITNIFLRGDCLKYINFLSLSDKELVIVALLSLSVLHGGRERSNQRQSSQDSFADWAHEAVLNG